jgi:predicted permease
MRKQEDFESEIRAHIEIEIDRLRKQGMSAEDAARAAQRTFGNTAAAGDRFYHGQRLAWLNDFLRDMNHARRGLFRTRAFLVTSVATLALAIGAVAGMFNVVNTVLLEPLPYPNPERLVALRGTAPGSDMQGEFGLGYDFYFHWKEQSKLIDGILAFGGGTSTFRTDNRVERIGMAWPTADMWAALGVSPALGRVPRPEENNQVVVISDQLWSSWFGRDSSVIGKSYFVSDGMKQIVGIMPATFKFPSDNTMLWVPVEPRLDQVQPGNLGLPIVARMKQGVTHEQLAAELTRIAKGLPMRFGGPPNYARLIDKFQARVVRPLDSMLGPTAQTALWVLLGAAAIVLLIACGNVSNLFLVRAEGRRRDMALRRAIGASRVQLVRFQMTEALIVALAAGVLAIVLSAVTLPLFLRAAPQDIPRLSDVGLDFPTVGAAFVIALIAALACGIVPAMRASSPDFNRLRDGGRGSTGVRNRLRDLLVVGQTALSLVLLIGSALLVQSFYRLSNVDPGYDTKDVYTFQFAPDRPDWRDGPSWGQLHNAFMDELRALPGVSAVGVVNNIPLDEGTSTWRFRTDAMTEESGGVLLDINFTGGDYFKAMGIALLQGRSFTSGEAVSPNTSVIISQTAAAKLWPNANALDQRVHVRFNPQTAFTFNVVGVVNDVKHRVRPACTSRSPALSRRSGGWARRRTS